MTLCTLLHDLLMSMSAGFEQAELTGALHA